MHSMPVRWFVLCQVALIALAVLCLTQWGCGRSKCEAPPGKKAEMGVDPKSPSVQAPRSELVATLDNCNDANTQFEDTVLCITGTGGFKTVPADDLKWATKDVGGKKCYLKRTSGDKTFHLTTDGVWQDDSCSSAQAVDGVISVKYLSDEYYNLLKEKPEMKGYFGIGDKVMVTVGGKTYRINQNEPK
jgi:hypothetical protein